MTKETPLSSSTMTVFLSQALERGWGSIESVAAGNLSYSGVGPSTNADRGRKRKRKEGSNTARTTRSTGGSLRRPPPRSPIRLESTSSVGVVDLVAGVGPVVIVAPTPEAPMTPLALLGGDFQFSKGALVGLCWKPYRRRPWGGSTLDQH